MSSGFLVTVFPALAVAVLAACSNSTGNSNEVDQTNIYGEYAVVQDAKVNEVKVLTWLRYAGQTGTTLRLTNDAELRVNEQKMNLVEGSSQVLNFTGSYYTQLFSVASQASEYGFEWKRNDQKVFRNNVPAPQKIEAFVLVDGTDTFVRAGETARVSVSAGGFQVTYEGSNLGDHETIRCTLTSDVSDSNANSLFFISGKWNSQIKNCFFKKSDLQDFRKGAAHIELTRVWRVENAAQGHERAGSTMSSVYVARPIACEILP